MADDFGVKLKQLEDNVKVVRDIITYCESSFRNSAHVGPVRETTQRYLLDATNAVANHVSLVSMNLTTYLQDQDRELQNATRRVQFMAAV